MERFLGKIKSEKQGGFLPKLHGETDVYTLVLDMDETLIHYSSYSE